MDQQSIDAARARILASWGARNWVGLWETLRVPGNKVSRGTLAPYGAPAATAPIKAWRAWLDRVSDGEAGRVLAERAARRAAEPAQEG